MDFGTNLYNLRKSRKMSQEKLAEKVGVSRQSISKWENGDAYPEMKNILILCDIFHCKLNELVNDSITDADSLDEEVKQSVVKFKEEQQRRIKLLSKITYMFAFIAKIAVAIASGFMILSMIALPFMFKYVEGSGNEIVIFDKKIEYSIDDSNIVIIDNNKFFVSTSTSLKEFIPSHNKIFYFISIEYAMLCILMIILCLLYLLIKLEKLYRNIYNGDTPFSLGNVECVEKIALSVFFQIIFPKASAIIYSLIVKLDLAIDFKITNIVILLILFSFTYIFKYGYEIQLDSKGKIYGDINEIK